ncbi:dihydroneopterin triphosphate diphosphatase [Neiella sp. HB171785]|uniref:Dihydroneopterin triphosphate diphosphatase n=2 Tax=Neiella TaxID=1434025 RepID=A0A8J6QI47_9GAMM|nr:MULTISPECIES: dihydroneopterin triphosphate diphosphatase [Neiella]MBD1388256.1 dihydroneopterin triphosphate diphosphatase [Neiella litorisoli]GGA76448.1 NUDIX pyrophosphatase [Neiella marina]
MTIAKRPVSVLVVITSQTGHALVMQRADDANFWQSVTGSLEWHELPEPAAIRELAEETGLTPQMGVWSNMNRQVCYTIRPQWRHRYADGCTTNTEHWFSLTLPSPTPIQLAPEEHLKFDWLPWRQALTRLSSPSNQQALRLLMTGAEQ